VGFPLSGYVPSGTFHAQVLRDSPALAPIVNALPTDFVGTLSYLGSQGVHLLLSEVNVINPRTETHPYPNFGMVSWCGNTDSSNYEGFSAAVKRSFSSGLFSQRITCDRTRSTMAQTAPGVSLTPPGGRSIGQWINPAAFVAPAEGTFGDAPRNIARGPGAWQMDFDVNKHIPLSKSVQLEFRSEFFNIFNHPQYGLPQSTFGIPEFGSIVRTVNTTTPVSPIGSGTPREIQFAPRLKF
jgi:hypothetical protein